MHTKVFAIAALALAAHAQAANYVRIPLGEARSDATVPLTHPATKGGVSPSEKPSLSVDSNLLDFGPVVAGQVATRTLAVKNSGKASLTFGAVQPPTSPYELLSSTCAAHLAPGAECTLDLRVAPGPASSATSQLVIPSDGGTASVGLKVSVLVPGASLSALTAFTGGIATLEQTQQLVVTNTGAAPLTLGTPSISGNTADFALRSSPTRPCASVLPAGASCELTVLFKTATAAGGTRPAATITVPNNGRSGQAQSVQSTLVNGTVIAGTRVLTPTEGQASAAPYDYGIKPWGSAPFSHTFTLVNSGNLSVVPTGITPGPGMTIGETNCYAGIAPNGGSCTVVVTHQVNNGQANNSFYVTYPSPTAPTSFRVFVTGRGDQLSMQYVGGSQSGNDWHYVLQSDSYFTEQVIEYVRLGDWNLNVPPGSFRVITDNCTGKRVAPRGTCDFTVRYAYDGSGVESTSLAVRFSAPSTTASPTLLLTVVRKF